MKIYTKTGDEGMSSLFDGGRFKKSDLRFHVYGEIDYLNVLVGEARLESTVKENKIYLSLIQSDLFTISSILAGADMGQHKWADKVIDMEFEIDKYWSRMPELKNFILPGGSKVSLVFHKCRVQCRRAERLMVELNESVNFDSEILKYINRLSDLFFCLARFVNFDLNLEDEVWIQH